MFLLTEICVPKNENMSYLARLIIGIILGGTLLGWLEIQRADSNFKKDLLKISQLDVRGFDVTQISALKKSARNSPVYERLQGQLSILARENRDCLSISLLANETNNHVSCLVKSTPDNKLNKAEIATPSNGNFDSSNAFVSRTPIIVGPSTSEMKKRFSVYVPIFDPQTVSIDHSSQAEARSLINDVVAYYKTHGKEQTLCEINKTNGIFHRRNLYVFAYDRKMTVLAHPIFPYLIGTNLLNKKDWSGGTYFRKEIQETARKGSGWIEYEFLNPLSQRVDHKTTFVQGLDDIIVCSGVYLGMVTVAALRVDFDASQWDSMRLHAVFFPLALTIFLVFATILGQKLLHSVRRHHPTFCVECVTTIFAGILITLILVRFVSQKEYANRTSAFEALAESRIRSLSAALTEIPTAGIQSLGFYCESVPFFSVDQFNLFTSYLVENTAVQAWEWVPRVMFHQKASFEKSIRDSETNNFMIWEKDADEKRIPVKDRDCYYPVTHIAPLTGNEYALGFDLGSEPLRKKALNEAERTRLPTATAPIKLVQETSSQKGILIYRPVFDRANTNQLRGFTLSVLRLGTLLRRSVIDSAVELELSFLHEDHSSENLATIEAKNHVSNPRLSMTCWQLAYGKVFAITAEAGPDFANTHPIRETYYVAAMGLGFTASLATMFSFLVRRRQRLEHLVLERTTELSESEQAQHDQFTKNSVIMLLVDPTDGSIVDVNHSALNFYGYSRERFLKMKFPDITTRTIPELLSILNQLKNNQGKKYLAQHRLSDGTLRDVEVSGSCVSHGPNQLIHTIIFDVTEQKKAEEDRARINRQLEEVNCVYRLLLKPIKLEAKLTSIASGMISIFSADICEIWLLKSLSKEGETPPEKSIKLDQKNFLTVLASSNPLASFGSTIPLNQRPGFSKIKERIISDGNKVLTVNGTNADPLENEGFLAAFKLYPSGENLIGVMFFASNQPITKSESVILEGLSNAIAITIHQAATQDALLKARDELENRVALRTLELSQANEQMRLEIIERRKAEELRQKAQIERDAVEAELRQTHKLEAIGQLAAGIAHEINTPTQYAGDNTRFIQQSFQTLQRTYFLYTDLLDKVKKGTVTPDLISNLEETKKADDVEYLFQETPEAISQTLIGIDRISKIVNAMKEFSHPGGKEKSPADLNRAIETTVTVARNEWKYVADVSLDLDPNLPRVTCFIGEFNQVILNLIVNAAHAIRDAIANQQDTKGKITITTHLKGEMVEVRVTDTGTGIPEAIRPRIFEPFFTTKELGKGTGQGLSVVYGTVVKRHQGTVTFETEVGKGTTFIIQLPISLQH